MKRKKKKAVKAKFPAHYLQMVGSHLRKVHPSSVDWSDPDHHFHFVIDREEIEKCDTSRLIHNLRPELDNPLFKVGPGAVFFSVFGYDEDPRDLVQIPEFRAFVRKVQQQAVCWLYFAMPGNAWLRIMAASAPHCRIFETNGKLRVAITTSQVAEFMKSQIRDYSRLCELMGIGGDVIDSHLSETVHESFPELMSSAMDN